MLNYKSFLGSTNQSTFYMNSSQFHQDKSTVTENQPRIHPRLARYTSSINEARNTLNYLLGQVQDHSVNYRKSINNVVDTNESLRRNLVPHQRESIPNYQNIQNGEVSHNFGDLPLTMLVDQTDFFSTIQSRVNERHIRKTSKNSGKLCIQEQIQNNIEMSRLLSEQIRKKNELQESRLQLINENMRLKYINEENQATRLQNKRLRAALEQLQTGRQTYRSSLIDDLDQLKIENQRLRINTSYLMKKLQ